MIPSAITNEMLFTKMFICVFTDRFLFFGTNPLKSIELSYVRGEFSLFFLDIILSDNTKIQVAKIS